MKKGCDWEDCNWDRILNCRECDFLMEKHPEFNCYLMHKPEPHKLVDERSLNFFKENHFVVGWNMFDPEWDNDTQVEQVFKRLIAIYNFSPRDENIVFERGPKYIYFEDHQYIRIPFGGVFVYDKTKVEVDCVDVPQQ